MTVLPGQSLDITSRPQTNIRVNFTNRGASKILQTARALDTDSPDRESIIDIANILSDVKIEKTEPVGFESIPELLGVDYVGYVIEKERLDKATGQWLRIDEYRILGNQANSFKDSRVAYGHTYRYRIKSICKATIRRTKRSQQNREYTQDIKEFEIARIKDSLEVQREVLASLDSLTNSSISSKVSTGQSVQIVDIIDGLSVRADAESTEMVRVPVQDTVSFLEGYKRTRNLRVSDLDLMQGTATRESLQKTINSNLAQYQEQVVEYRSFYFSSNPSKKWQYVNVVETVPPPPPSSIKIVPNTRKREIFISWLKPANDQRDIVGYKVYRRRKLGDNWRVVATLKERETLFIDRGLRGKGLPLINRGWIYAISCVDVHGIEGPLSVQIKAFLNPNFDNEKEEKPLKWISGGGVLPVPEENKLVLKKFRDVDKPMIVKKNIVVGPKKHFNETQKPLIIKVTSLDTHETLEFKLNLRNINTKDILT